MPPNSPISDQAIVLRVWDFSETSQTVSLLTREHGILRGLGKGSRRPRGSFDAGFEMLTRGHIGAIVKPTAEMATLTEWGLTEIFPHLRTSLRAHRASIYLADLTHNLFQPGDPHPTLFDGLARSLRDLAEDAWAVPVVLRYQWVALREAGYRPITDRDAQSDDPLPKASIYAFSAPAGGVVRDPGPSPAPEGVWRLRADTLKILIGLDGDELPTDDQAVGRASRLLSTYLAWVLSRRLASAAAWERVLGPEPGGGGGLDRK